MATALSSAAILRVRAANHLRSQDKSYTPDRIAEQNESDTVALSACCAPIATVRFSVPGKPRGWQRVGRNPTTGRAFKPRQTRSEQAGIGYIARAAMRGMPPWLGPVLMTVRAVFPIPTSWPEWKRQAAAEGLILHTAKPDLDNIIKLIKDALPGIAYKDDAQVAGYPGQPVKLYGCDPGIHVTLKLLPAIESSFDARAARLGRPGMPS